MKNTSFSSENTDNQLSKKSRSLCDNTMSVAILSGKGGVGKTNLALNIARMLYLKNEPALLMDCDLGLANIDVLLGLHAQHNLHDVISNQIEAHEAIVPIEENGFDFIPAASGLPELIQLDEDSIALLFSQLDSCLPNYRYLFMDLGAGISSTVLSFASIAHARIIVITPEPTSITDGYAVMKVLNAQHGITDFHILINQVSNRQEYELASRRLCEATSHFLGFTPKIIGFVQQDQAVLDAVIEQTPFTRKNPQSPASKNVIEIAEQIRRLRTSLANQIKNGPILTI